MNILGRWLASVLNKCPEGQDETEINLEYISKGNKSLEIRIKGVSIFQIYSLRPATFYLPTNTLTPFFRF